MALEIRIDRDACVGSGNCCEAAPGVFAIDLVSLAVVVDPSAASEPQILAAAADCPTDAIVVLRKGQQLS